VLTQTLSWNWIFFVNIPSRDRIRAQPVLLTESRDARVKAFDGNGCRAGHRRTLLVVFAITQVVSRLALRKTSGSSRALSSCSWGFVLWSWRHREPLRLASVRERRDVAGLIMARRCSRCSDPPLYMQHVLGYSPMKTGVAYLAVAGRRSSGLRRRAARHALSA